MALTLSQIVKVEKSLKGKSIATIVYERLTMIAPMSKWYNCDHYLYRLGRIRKVAILISVAHMSWVPPQGGQL